MFARSLLEDAFRVQLPARMAYYLGTFLLLLSRVLVSLLSKTLGVWFVVYSNWTDLNTTKSRREYYSHIELQCLN